MNRPGLLQRLEMTTVPTGSPPQGAQQSFCVFVRGSGGSLCYCKEMGRRYDISKSCPRMKLPPVPPAALQAFTQRLCLHAAPGGTFHPFTFTDQNFSDGPSWLRHFALGSFYFISQRFRAYQQPVQL